MQIRLYIQLQFVANSINLFRNCIISKNHQELSEKSLSKWKGSFNILPKFKHSQSKSTSMHHIPCDIKHHFPSWFWRIYAIIWILCDRENIILQLQCMEKVFILKHYLKSLKPKRKVGKGLWISIRLSFYFFRMKH